MTERDREAILRRRAFYVTSTLAALSGCATTTPLATAPTAPEPDALIASKEPGPHGAGGAQGADTIDPPATTAPIIEGAPTLDIPPGLRRDVEDRYVALRLQVSAIHKVLLGISANEPESCDFADERCRAGWQRTADRWHHLENVSRMLGRCDADDKSEQHQAFLKRCQEHLAFIAKRKATLRRTLEVRLGESEGNPAAKYTAMERYRAHPQICLNFSSDD